MLYRTGGDTLLVLTKALSQHRKSKHNVISQPHCSISCTADSFDSQLVQVCTEMNNRLHAEAKQVIQKDKSSQIDVTTFNVERFMSSIEPCILKMVVLLTRSCRSSRKPINTLVSELPHTKKLCCFYCVCVYCSSVPTTSVACLPTFCSQILTTMVEQLSSNEY